MKILVCISKTPDTTAKITFRDGGLALDSTGITFIMNPYDEWYALVKALELQEKWGGTVSLVHVGMEDSEPIIRKGLAIGASDAFRIACDATSADQVAFQIATLAREQGFDILFTGKEAIDYQGAEVGSRIAAQLDVPFVSFASFLEMDSEKTARIRRDIEGGTETVQVDVPLVVSAAKGMAEQRIPNMRGIMTAKSKPLHVVTPVTYTGKVRVISHALPPAKKAVQFIAPDNMAELARLLREEAKVI